MGPYLLDTNIISSLIKQPSGSVARRVREVGEAAVCTSIIVACELRYGAAKKGSAPLAAKVNQLLSVLDVLPLDRNADERYAEVRAALEKEGRLIGANDLLIAAHALTQEATLVTNNTRELKRVKGLALENWL